MVTKTEVNQKLLKACKHAIKYDKAIESCGNEPKKMSSYCTAEGETLDKLYSKWIESAKQAIIKAEGENNSNNP